MKNNSIKIFTILVITLILNSCCKDENPLLAGCQKQAPEYYHKTINGAKNYLWAKKGSYWIYKNTKTGDLDTQLVVGFLFRTDTSEGFDSGLRKKRRLIFFVYQKLFVNIYSTFNQWTYMNRTNDYALVDGQDLNREFVIYEHSVFSEGSGEPFFYPFDVGRIGGASGSSYTTLKEIIPSYTLLGKTYQNVAVFEMVINPIWEPKLGCQRPKTKYYWAENVGLIKKEFITCNYAWELTEHNIIQ